MGSKNLPTLCNKARIRLLFQESKKVFKFPIVILFRENGGLDTEILYCSDKSSRKAVERNRTKRILRAIVRENASFFPKYMDIAIIGNKAIHDLEHSMRNLTLVQLVRKIQK